MVVVSGEIGGQSLDVRGDFQKAIRKPVSLRFGNGCITATARNPFGSLEFVRPVRRAFSWLEANTWPDAKQSV
jgi:hypothetical protein